MRRFEVVNTETGKIMETVYARRVARELAGALSQETGQFHKAQRPARTCYICQRQTTANPCRHCSAQDLTV
jgi:hypothetical protein